MSQNFDREPAFCWWVPYTLRSHHRIIASVRARVRKLSHKYGIEIPRTVEEAYAIDEKNGNSIWRDAINKEMENLKVAFGILPDGKEPQQRKARWVKDGHRTPEPSWSTYA